MYYEAWQNVLLSRRVHVLLLRRRLRPLLLLVVRSNLPPATRSWHSIEGASFLQPEIQHSSVPIWASLMADHTLPLAPSSIDDDDLFSRCSRRWMVLLTSLRSPERRKEKSWPLLAMERTHAWAQRVRKSGMGRENRLERWWCFGSGGAALSSRSASQPRYRL